jgi:hypothetical protein
MTPVRSSMAEVLLCLKRDSSDGMEQSPQSQEAIVENSDELSTIDKTDSTPEEIVCNCKKSRCLKLYVHFNTLLRRHQFTYIYHV